MVRRLAAARVRPAPICPAIRARLARAFGPGPAIETRPGKPWRVRARRIRQGQTKPCAATKLRERQANEPSAKVRRQP